MTDKVKQPLSLEETIERNKKIKRIVFDSLKYASLILMFFVVVIPIIAVFLGSFKTADELLTTSGLAFPKNFFNYDNYIRAFAESDMLMGFLNTTIIMVISLFISIFCGATTAFVLSRFEFVGKKIIKSVFLIVSLIPTITTQVITYRVLNSFGLINTYMSAFLMFGGTDIISIYIFLQFLENVSKTLDESAKLDGANSYQIFFMIIVPLLVPAIATVSIIKFVGIYNEFYIPLLYIPDVPMVSTALYSFKSAFGTSWETISAGQIIVIVPMLVVFILLQKQIYSGLTAGSVKG